MKLEFNNINEILDFLQEIGYSIEKKDLAVENTSEIETTEDKDDKNDWIKDFPKNPYPYIPTNPYNPWYPNYPIVSWEAMRDPNLSSKFGTCLK